MCFGLVGLVGRYIRGAYAPAVAAKVPVKNTQYTLDQIVNQDAEDLGECLWDKVQIAVNASHPGARFPPPLLIQLCALGSFCGQEADPTHWPPSNLVDRCLLRAQARNRTMTLWRSYSSRIGGCRW